MHRVVHRALSSAVVSALALSAASTALAAEITVTQSGFTFVPATVTVAPGDTITWVRTSLTHTITSGSNCEADGLFAGLISGGEPTWSWTVPAKAAGQTIPYFCEPHCAIGHVGTIVVTSPAPSPDLNGDGLVNGADLATMLSQWGGPGSADIDGSGQVGGPDLATLLGAWTG